MAFPVVAATSKGHNNGGASPHALGLPASIAAGDLLVLALTTVTTGAPYTVTTPSGWTLFSGFPLSHGDSARVTNIYWKIASGSEGATVSVTMSTANPYTVHHAYRITGGDGNAPTIASAGPTTSTNPDPPSLTPGGGSKEFLWLAFGVRAVAFSAGPSGYLGYILEAGQFVTNMGSAYKQAAASSEDPGAFTATSGVWVAFTIAVAPVTAQALTLAGIASEEAFGLIVVVTPGPVTLTLAGIASEEAFGNIAVVGGGAGGAGGGDFTWVLIV